jgi:hypothetical protein
VDLRLTFFVEYRFFFTVNFMTLRRRLGRYVRKSVGVLSFSLHKAYDAPVGLRLKKESFSALSFSQNIRNSHYSQYSSNRAQSPLFRKLSTFALFSILALLAELTVLAQFRKFALFTVF